MLHSADIPSFSCSCAPHPRHPPILQVALNQLVLAPVTISVAFAWNLALQGKLEQLPAKLRADFVTTMQNGWKFWVPAATVNFVAVPLRHQVGPAARGQRWLAGGAVWAAVLPRAGRTARAAVSPPQT